MNRRVVAFLLCVFLGAIHTALAADSAPSELTVERIYASNDFNEASFSAQWVEDGLDGKSMAYWQRDTTDVPEFVMIDHLSGSYPQLRWAYDSSDLLIQHMNRLQHIDSPPVGAPQ